MKSRVNIARTNYEEWFIDYYDGMLSAEDKKRLYAFLKANPDLEEEFYTFKAVSLASPSIPFKAKSSLKKTILPTGNINETNYEDYFVASAEGDLAKSELDELNLFLDKNDYLKRDKEIYKSIRLRPDTSVNFSQKGTLKRTRTFSFSITYYALAAVFLGALLLLFLNKEESEVNPVEERKIIAHEIPLVKLYENTDSNSVASSSKISGKITSKNAFQSTSNINKKTIQKEKKVIPVPETKTNTTNQMDLVNQSGIEKSLEKVVKAELTKFAENNYVETKQKQKITETQEMSSTIVEIPEAKSDVLFPLRFPTDSVDKTILKFAERLRDAPTSLSKKELKEALKDVTEAQKYAVGNSTYSSWLSLLIKRINILLQGKSKIKYIKSPSGKLTQIGILTKNFEFSKTIHKNED